MTHRRDCAPLMELARHYRTAKVEAMSLFVASIILLALGFRVGPPARLWTRPRDRVGL